MSFDPTPKKMSASHSFPWFSPFLVVAALVLVTGCATTRQVVHLPYAFPTATGERPNGSVPDVVVVRVTDSRGDRSLDMFLNERLTDYIGKALAAELEAGGTYTHVATDETDPAVAPLALELDLRDVSWAVPNHSAMVKTAFWTSFLTGGLGGLAYGATETPVFGRAAFALRITDRATAQVIVDREIEAVHEERVAKLKSDTLETRARVMAAALKAAMTKANQAVLDARSQDAGPAAEVENESSHAGSN